jgi:gluconate 2-dehydrogenase gamma chain
MNRREFIQCAAVLAAGSTVIPNTWSMSHEQHRFLAAEKSYISDKPLTFFSDQQRAVVKVIAQLIIPTTDTPGAIEAGSDRFIELMVADWFTPQERDFFIAGLNDLMAQQNDFIGLSATEQIKIMEQLEDDASDSPWFDFGNTTRVWDGDAPFICQFKELTVLGFLLSEVGSQQVLRLNPMGSFKGDIPLLDTDVSYAAELPMRQDLAGL